MPLDLPDGACYLRNLTGQATLCESGRQTLDEQIIVRRVSVNDRDRGFPEENEWFGVDNLDTHAIDAGGVPRRSEEPSQIAVRWRCGELPFPSPRRPDVIGLVAVVVDAKVADDAEPFKAEIVVGERRERRVCLRVLIPRVLNRGFDTHGSFRHHRFDGSDPLCKVSACSIYHCVYQELCRTNYDREACKDGDNRPWTG